MNEANCCTTGKLYLFVTTPLKCFMDILLWSPKRQANLHNKLGNKHKSNRDKQEDKVSIDSLSARVLLGRTKE